MPQPEPNHGTASSQRQILGRSLTTALVVGTALNLINQGEYLLAGGGLMWGHALLNYLVPFCVAAFSAWQTQRQCPPQTGPGACGVQSDRPARALAEAAPSRRNDAHG